MLEPEAGVGVELGEVDVEREVEPMVDEALVDAMWVASAPVSTTALAKSKVPFSKRD